MHVTLVLLVHHRRKEVYRAPPAPPVKQVPVPMVHAKPVKQVNSEQLRQVQLPVRFVQLVIAKAALGKHTVSHAFQENTKLQLGRHRVWIANQTHSPIPSMQMHAQIAQLENHRRLEVCRAWPVGRVKQAPESTVHARHAKPVNIVRQRRLMLRRV